MLPDSTEILAQRVTSPFSSIWEAFQGAGSDFQDLAISAMFKSMGYCPGFLLKNDPFRILTNSLEVDTYCRGTT